MTPATVTQLHRYVIERIDHDNGDISYEVIETWPERRTFCVFYEDQLNFETDGDISAPRDLRGQAKKDAEMAARALNYWNIRGATA